MADSEKSPSIADAHKTEKPNFTGCLVWIMLLFLILWLCWPKIVSWWSTPSSDDTATVSYSDIGSFGDLFGSFNALVSMLAFIGFLCALYLQRKDLQLQREEMKQSRREMELQTTQFREQTELLKEQIAQQNKQNIISIFYNRAYKYDELIQNFSTLHRGKTFLNAVSRLIEFYIYKGSDRYIEGNNIINDYNDYIKAYFELQTLYLKLYLILDEITSCNIITQDEMNRIVRILVSSCNDETKGAFSYFCVIGATSVNHKDKKGLVKLAIGVTESDVVKGVMARQIEAHLNNDIRKRAEIAEKSAADVVNMFLEHIHNGVDDFLE